MTEKITTELGFQFTLYFGHIDKISIELPILYFKGSRVEVSQL